MLQAIHDPKLMWLFGGVLCLLAISSLIGGILKARHRSDASRPTIDNLNARTRAWWKMCAIFALSLLVGSVASLVLFAIISFLALREYITLVPTRRGDHRTLFWSFFIIMPLQYYLVGIQLVRIFRHYDSRASPSSSFLRSIAIAGDTEHFLERAAKIQFGLMVCAYCLSHAPALLTAANSRTRRTTMRSCSCI